MSGRRVVGSGGDEGAVGEGGVIMNEGEEEGGAAGDKVDCENEGKGDAEVVLGEGLALISGVGLVVDMEGVADLDEGGAGEGVVGEGIEGGEVVEVVAGGGVELEGETEDGKAGDLGVGVDNVEGGVSQVGRAEVVVELVAAGRGLDAGGDEAVLMKGKVAVAGMAGEAAGEHAGGEATDDGMAGERAGGGGPVGGGGKSLGLLVGLDLAVEGFGGEAAAVGGGGVEAVDLL